MKHKAKRRGKIYKGTFSLKTSKNQLGNEPITCKHLKDAILASFLVWVFAADKEPTIHTRLPSQLYANSIKYSFSLCSLSLPTVHQWSNVLNGFFPCTQFPIWSSTHAKAEKCFWPQASLHLLIMYIDMNFIAVFNFIKRINKTRKKTLSRKKCTSIWPGTISQDNDTRGCTNPILPWEMMENDTELLQALWGSFPFYLALDGAESNQLLCHLAPGQCPAQRHGRLCKSAPKPPHSSTPNTNRSQARTEK